MDPANPVIKLCAQGMEEEAGGDLNAAASLFRRAWERSANDFERCIAAHYGARHQPSALLTLQWNQVALDCAKRIEDGSANPFLPSLYLNLGKSHEDLGDTAMARRLYDCAADRIDPLPADAYRDIVQDGITRGLQRVAAPTKSF